MTHMMDDRWVPPVLESGALRVEIIDAGAGVAGVRVLAGDGYPLTNTRRMHRECLGRPGQVAINLDRIAAYPRPTAAPAAGRSPDLDDTGVIVLSSCGRWWQSPAGGDPLDGMCNACWTLGCRPVAVLTAWEELEAPAEELGAGDTP